MGWLISIAATTLLCVAIVIVVVNRNRWQGRVARDVASLLAISQPPSVRLAVALLPPPVARYHELAGGARSSVQTLSLRHGGTFCVSTKSKPVPIRGSQVFTADPPGFVWSARVTMAPGLWVDARDMAVNGRGSMLVLFESTFTIADASGPELDQGSALRLLAEMVWYPTSLFDARYVTWSAIDACHARATLRVGIAEVSGVFEFGPDGLPVSMSAERFMDKGELRPWGGTYHDWRNVAGMWVPFEAMVTWQLESGPFTYAHWRVETMEYDSAKDA